MDKKEKGEIKGPVKFSKSAVIALTIIVAVGVIVYLVWQPSINQVNENIGTSTTDRPATLESIAKGKLLSQTYCQSCHMYPEAALLNRFKWKNVFPQMGLRMGIKAHNGESYTGSIKARDLVVPARPLLNDEQWQDIIDFYMNTAPIALPKQNRVVQIKRELPFFSYKAPPDVFSGKQVLGCYVKIDNTVNPARIFVANGIANKLYLFNNKLKVIDSVSTTGPVVDMLFDHENIFVCTIGKDLGANSNKFGTVTQLHVGKPGKMELDSHPLFTNLARPVQVLAADLNGDNKTDYVISEFGNITGELCWMENKGNGTFSRHVIRTLPGAIKAYIDYVPNKKTPDLWVLFAQGEEGIYHFINKGNGEFEQKRILRFPPIYGSSFFEMVDINHDGYKDIVYTCGDNGNATLVLKPYHGVYIFLNDGRGNYKQQYFFPINGCYKAYARDFDGDGNIDIATISLYTDARQPAEGFVYLKNAGSMNFTPYALPPDTRFERAVTMDEGDLNGDGKPDLLIGNAYFDFGPFAYNIKEPLFFTLKNKQ